MVDCCIRCKSDTVVMLSCYHVVTIISVIMMMTSDAIMTHNTIVMTGDHDDDI